MSCHDRDSDLLLLAHGALPAMRRLWILAHLHRCPRCRDRQEELLCVSRAVASALRASQQATWLAPGPAVAVAQPLTLRWALTMGVIFLLAALGIAALLGRTASSQPHGATLSGVVAPMPEGESCETPLPIVRPSNMPAVGTPATLPHRSNSPRTAAAAVPSPR